MFELLSNITAARVSVLDLDNAVRFSPAYLRAAEEKAKSKSFPQNIILLHQTEMQPILGASNSVDCYFEIAFKVTVSL